MSNTLKNNAYHILGLDTTASQKDILKRAKEIINRLKIGDLPEYDLDIELFENFRTEETVKDAIQKIQTPKKRIREYFFWFQFADSVDEEVLGFIKKKDYPNAIRTWRNAAEGNSTKALAYRKNLAVLYSLLLALDNNEEYLRESLSLWKGLIDSEKFWTAFEKIYKLHNEQTASHETITDFRNQVIGFLADMYTELHHLHKDTTYINDFQKVFSAKGEKIEKTILGPAYQAINEAVEGLEKMKISEDGVIDNSETKKIKTFIGIIQGELNKLIDLGLYEDSQTRVMRDRAGEEIRKISLDIHNTLNEREMALHLSEIANKISGTAGLKNLLEKDRETIKNNIEEEKKNPMGHCWFCQVRIKDQVSSLSEKMHKVTKTEQTFSGRRIHYQMYELTIPRCVNCANFHKENDSKYTKIGIGVGLVGGIIISVLGEFGFWGLAIMTIISIFVGIWIFGAIGNRKGTDQIKPINYKRQFPSYKDLLANGWQVGEKPSN